MFTLLRGLNQNVQYVDRRHNNLKEVPEDILSAKCLEELLLDSNHIRLLPKVNMRRIVNNLVIFEMQVLFSCRYFS